MRSLVDKTRNHIKRNGILIMHRRRFFNKNSSLRETIFSRVPLRNSFGVPSPVIKTQQIVKFLNIYFPENFILLHLINSKNSPQPCKLSFNKLKRILLPSPLPTGLQEEDRDSQEGLSESVGRLSCELSFTGELAVELRNRFHICWRRVIEWKNG